MACHHTLPQEALASGALRPGGLVTEGTAGSTGISLAMVAPAFGAAPPKASVRTHVRRQCFAQLSLEAGCLAACAVVQRSHVWCAAVPLRCVLARRLPLPRCHAGRRCGGEGGHHPRAGRDCAARAPGVHHAPGALCERGAPRRRGAACVACTPACLHVMSLAAHLVCAYAHVLQAATAAGGPGAGFFADQFENIANFRAHFEARSAREKPACTCMC